MQQERVEVLWSGVAELGEGPTWAPPYLYFVDILQKTLHRYNVEEKVHSCWVLPHSRAQGGGLLVALEDGIARISVTAEERLPVTFDWVVKRGQDPQPMRFNDGKVDPSGRFWVGTMDLNKVHLPVASLYCLAEDGSLKERISNVSVSNGLAWWQHEGRMTMYYVDTNTQSVAAFDFDCQTGLLSNRRVVVEIPRATGRPDGMTIDSEGKLWIAHLDGGRVCRWDPTNGALLRTVHIPGVTLVTSVCFGGPLLEDLYVTTGNWKLTTEQRAQQPTAGAVFVIRNLGVRGLPERPARIGIAQRQ